MGVAHTNALSITKKSVWTIIDHEPLRPADGIIHGSTGHPNWSYLACVPRGQYVLRGQFGATRRLFFGRSLLRRSAPRKARSSCGARRRATDPRLQEQQCSGRSNGWLAAASVGGHRLSHRLIASYRQATGPWRSVAYSAPTLGLELARPMRGTEAAPSFGGPTEDGHSDTVAFFH